MKHPPEDLAQKLIAASDQFVGTGLDVSIDDVALAAGVPRATLYYYFSGRDDLVSFYLLHKLNSVGDAIAKAAAGEGSVRERLENMTREVLRAMAAQPALCTELPAALRTAGPNVTEIAGNAERVLMAPVRELLIEGRATGELAVDDVGLTATALHGLIGNTAMMLLMRDGTFDPDAVADQVNSLLFDGLAPR